MKFFICVVVLFVLSMNTTQAALIPYPSSSLPIVYSTAYGQGTTIGNSHTIIYHTSTNIPDGTHLYSPSLVVPQVAFNSYVAKTLGSEQIASLPGHLISASLINLNQAHAPGIKKAEVEDSNSITPSAAIYRSLLPASFPLSYSPLIVQSPIVVPYENENVAKNLGIGYIIPLPENVVVTSLNSDAAPL